MKNEALRKQMYLKDVNVSTLSRASAVPIHVIQNFLTGKTHKPDYESVKKLADYFDVSVDYLYARKASPVQTPNDPQIINEWNRLQAEHPAIER